MRISVLMGVLCLLGTPVLAQRGPGERMIAEQFAVSPGGTLEVRVADANLEILPSAKGEARVEVFLDGRSMPRARDYFAQQRFALTQEGNTVSVTTDAPDNGFRFWDWEHWGWVSILVRAEVPAGFHLDLQTADGNIRVGQFNGRTHVRTADGNITVGRLEGPDIALRTSDGDITAETLTAPSVLIQTSDGNLGLQDIHATTITVRTSDGNITGGRLEGDLDLSTSDGNIALDEVRGGHVSLTTSDGSITTKQIEAYRAEVVSSDGNLHLGLVDGALRASTSSGDIRVRLVQPAEYALRTSSGDIYITAPSDLRASLNLRAEDLRIATSFRFRGDLDDESATGNLNGGGPLLEARASDGTIVLSQH